MCEQLIENIYYLENNYTIIRKKYKANTTNLLPNAHNRCPDLYSNENSNIQHQCQRNGKLYLRKRRTRFCPWQAIPGRREQASTATYLLPVCNIAYNQNNSSSIVVKNQNCSYPSALKVQNKCLEPLSDYSCSTNGQNCRNALLHKSSTKIQQPNPLTNGSEAHFSMRKKFAGQKQYYQSQEMSRGILKRYRTITKKPALQFRKSQNISRISPNAPPNKFEPPHVKFSRKGNHALAMKTALTYFAQSKYYNAPRPSELPKPPSHWVIHNSKVHVQNDKELTKYR